MTIPTPVGSLTAIDHPQLSPSPQDPSPLSDPHPQLASAPPDHSTKPTHDVQNTKPSVTFLDQKSLPQHEEDSGGLAPVTKNRPTPNQRTTKDHSQTVGQLVSQQKADVYAEQKAETNAIPNTTSQPNQSNSM